MIVESQTLIDEYSNTFSSTKAPVSNRRRTIFDISMDIINQRVENINRAAKLNRSVSDPDAREHIDECDSPSLSADVLGKNAEKHAAESENAATTIANGSSMGQTEAPVKKTKRKLFVPPSMVTNFEATLTPRKTVPPREEKNGVKRARDDEAEATTKPGQKRPKILGEGASAVEQTSVTAQSASGAEKKQPKSSRRSTIFFEPFPKPSKPVAQRSTAPPQPVLVYTNMHQAQIESIKEVRS